MREWRGIARLGVGLILPLCAACGGPEGRDAPLVAPISPIKAASVPNPVPTKTVAPTRKVTTAKPTTAAAPKPIASHAASPAPSAQRPTDLLATVKATMDAMTSYQAVITATDDAKDGHKQVRTTTMIRYRAPGTYRFDVQSSTNAMASGSKTVLVSGEPTLKARAGGVLGIAKMTLSVNDANVVTTNGWSPDRIVMKAVLDRVSDGSYTVSVAGTTSVGDTPVKVLKVASTANGLDSDIAYELIGFEDSHTMRYWACYGAAAAGGTNPMLYQMVVDQITANPSLADSIFSL